MLVNCSSASLYYNISYSFELPYSYMLKIPSKWNTSLVSKSGEWMLGSILIFGIRREMSEKFW